MVFEHIENLKREYTDKYVVVNEQLPELKRFAGHTGFVKTVNMSGRALVEFGYDENIGWYDIDVDFLKIVDAPPPAEDGKAKAAPTKAAPAKPAAKKAEAKPASAGGMDVADILAAARGGGGGAAPAAEKAESKPAAKPAAKGMSVEEMLAAARGEKSQAAEPAAPARRLPQLLLNRRNRTAAATPPAATGDLPTEVADILAFCRERDGS